MMALVMIMMMIRMMMMMIFFFLLAMVGRLDFKRNLHPQLRRW